MHYDLIIVGGGPAAIAGGIYAARKQLRTLIIAKEFGGQSVVSPEIYNWIGTPSISGRKLAESLERHLREYEGDFLDIRTGECANKVSKIGEGYAVVSDTGDTYSGKNVLLATGANRRKLTVPGAKEFDQKGLTYCATCDGPMFAGMDVAVIGGGNAGFEAALQLAMYAKTVTLLDTGAAFKADPITVKKAHETANITTRTNALTLEVLGDTFVTGLRYKDTKSGAEQTLAVTGIFVEIGSIPNSEMVDGVVERTESGHVKIDPWNQRTSTKGIWAAGDCTNSLYSQNNIAVGDAIKAIEDIYMHL